MSDGKPGNPALMSFGYPERRPLLSYLQNLSPYSINHHNNDDNYDRYYLYIT